MVLIAGLMRFRRRQLVRGSLQCLSALSVGLTGAVVFLVGLNLLTFERFTNERPVAELRFKALAPQDYRVRVHLAGGRRQTARLHGDEWQLDARIIKWKSFATLLGFDPLYRVERLSGRYETLHAAQTRAPSVVGVGEPRGISLWDFAHRESRWLPFVDARYGSATFLPMADGARYLVTIGNSGLIARPINQAARTAVRNWR